MQLLKSLMKAIDYEKKKAAPAVAPPKSGKKGKRDAEETPEKQVAAKKQKKNDGVAQAIVKKEVEAKTQKKKEETSSSSDDSSESEDEPAPVKKQAAVVKNGSVPAKKAKQASSSDSSDSSSEEGSSSDEEAPAKNTKPAVAKKAAVPAAKTVKADSSSDSSSDDDSDEDDEPAAKKEVAAAKNGAAPVKKGEISDSSDEDSSSDEDDEKSKPAPKKEPTAVTKKESSDSSESDSSSDEDVKPPPKNIPSATAKPKTESSDSSSEEESDEEDVKKAPAVRKASAPPPKKVEDSSSDSSDDSESEDEETPKKEAKVAKKASSSEEEESEESDDDEESDEEEAPKKKDTDVEMVDATTPAKQDLKSAKKVPQTPVTPQTQSTGSKTLFVGNLSFQIEDADVRNFFKGAGEVVEVRFSSDAEGNFKGYGHVEFATAEAAQKALELNGEYLMNRAVRLDLARERGAYTPYSGNGNNSFQKGGKGQSRTIFVKGLDASLDEDTIRNSLQEHFGICGETWWDSSKALFTGCSSPCSTGLAADMGSFGWSADMVDIKARSSCEESKDSLAFPLGAQQGDSDSCGSSILNDSTLQMMGFGLSSSTTSDWNQSLLRSNGRSESYNSVLQEGINSRLSCRKETGMDSSQIQKEWSPRSYTSPGEDSSITTFKPLNQDFSLEQQRLNSLTSSGNSRPTCQFPIGSVSYGYPSTLLQTLFDPDSQAQSQQLSLFNNNRSIDYMSATATYGANNATESSPSWPRPAPFVRPSLPKQQPSNLHFTNNAPLWNASATGVNDVKAGFSPSQLQREFLLQTFEEKPNCPSLTKKTNTEEVRNSGSPVKKGLSSEPPLLKRPRIETPSPLPTFKVRKEKLGDRITALQQLVSPFGKTDTASVLHEAIEYIKFLHDQVNVLITPYMKQAVPSTQQQSTESLKEPEGPKQDLRSLGLCLVPISSTFPVANETTVDFWTPTFGGTFR